MTSSQRRNSFRLPWLSEEPDEDVTLAEADAPGAPEADAAPRDGDRQDPVPDAPAEKASVAAAQATQPEPDASAKAGTAGDEPPAELLSELVAAMRGVAENARATGLSDLHQSLEAHIERLRADSEARSSDLRQRAESDVTGIGEWAKAEAERIKAEAERRVGARRQQLDQQLSAEARRIDQEIDATRARVTAYEREFEAFFAQLGEITDPSAFAAAVKRMPGAPEIGAESRHETARTAAATPERPTEAEPVEAPAGAVEAQGGSQNGNGPLAAEQARSDEALAERLAELDADIAEEDTSAPQPDRDAATSSSTTTIVVQGLRSFGAITAFKQALAGADGIDAVSLSLGPTGEFVYRATHAAAFDIEAAIVELESGDATVARDADGSLRVTVERTR